MISGGAASSANGRLERERNQRRAFRSGLAVSAILHLGFVWFGRGLHLGAMPYPLPSIETVPAPEGLVVVEIASRTLESLPEDPRPEPPPPQIEPTDESEPQDLEVVEEEEEEGEEGLPSAPGVGEPGGPPGPEEGERVSNASRLRLRFSDPRLWFDPSDPMLFGERLARFARADSAVRAILRDWLDSLSLTTEQQRRATDWTFERDGKRWGISPEGIHLGDITIPIPIGFAPSGPNRRAFEQAIRDLAEIQLQDLKADIEEITNERRRAMRERSEEEVRRRRGADTLRVRAPP